MKIFKSITIITCLLVTTFAFAQWGNGKKIKGNGNITTITRSTADYNGIKTAGPIDFKLVPGKEGNITITGDANILDFIITELKEGKLVVKVKKGTRIKPSKKISVTIPYKSINSVVLAGSGDITNEGKIQSNTFNVALAGSGKINLNIEASTTKTNITGSGDIKLKGKTTNLNAKITGSGDFDGLDLVTQNANATITGSGQANVICNGNLKVKITGSGDVNYKGKPKNKNIKTVGSGKVLAI